MNSTEEFHAAAMDLADQAIEARRDGNADRAAEFFRQAFEKERQAVTELLLGEHCTEPIRSILCRSAATLALDCNDLYEAQRFVDLAVNGAPPNEIRQELDHISKEIFHRHEHQINRHQQQINRYRGLWLFENTNFDFVGKKWPFVIASLVLTLAGIGSLIAKGGPLYGIDFRGGVLMYVRFQQQPPEDQIRKALSSKIPGEILIQRITNGSTSNEVIILTELSQDEKQQDVNRTAMQSGLKAVFGEANGKLDFHNASQAQIVDVLQTAATGLNNQQLNDAAKAVLQYRNTPPRSGLIGSFDELAGTGVKPSVISGLKDKCYLSKYAIRNIEVVSPKVGKELQQKALEAMLLALAGMLVFIAFRFEWIYGVTAVIAVFHDTIIMIGLFSILNKEISLTVIAAFLTLVGFSMNDTLVVFDRILENLRFSRKKNFESVVNTAINQTLSRTIMTSGMTFLTALTLWIFGGEVLNGFSFALMVGIIVGTFSSVFIASPILIFCNDWAEARKKAQLPAWAPASGAAKRGVVSSADKRSENL